MRDDARISVERSIRVYDDDHGWFVRVGPDPDTGESCDVRYFDQADKVELSWGFVVPWEHAEKVADAILELVRVRRAQSEAPQ